MGNEIKEITKSEYNDFFYNRYMPAIKRKTPTVPIRKTIYNLFKLIKDGNGSNQIFHNIKQQFGLNISATLLKDRPVNIINIQNANISEIAIGLLEVFDECDNLDSQFENSVETLNLVEASEIFASKCADQKMTYKQFQDYANSAFILENIARSKTDKQAAEIMGMNRPYLARLKKQLLKKGEKEK